MGELNKKDIIDAMAVAIQNARRELYDVVKNATNSEPTNSNLQARDIRKDLAEFFAQRALQAFLKMLPEEDNEWRALDILYELLAMKKKDA